MLIRQLLLITAGASYGLLSAAGVFTVLVAVGLIPRFAGKTHTARYVLLYEEMVIFGTLAGCFVTIFRNTVSGGAILESNFRNMSGCGRQQASERRQFSESLPECLSAVWHWQLPRCWTVFLFCEKDFVPAWSGMGDSRDGGGKIVRFTVLFCNRTAPDGAVT